MDDYTTVVVLAGITTTLIMHKLILTLCSVLQRSAEQTGSRDFKVILPNP